MTGFGLELLAIELVERDDFTVAGAHDLIVRLKRRFVLLTDLRLMVERRFKLGRLDDPLGVNILALWCCQRTHSLWDIAINTKKGLVVELI